MATGIRRYAEGDCERLRPLARAQFDSDTRADAYLDHLRSQAGSGALTLLVAEEGDALIGCVAVSTPAPAGEEAGTAGRYAMVSDLYVVPAHRGHGLGRALTRRAEQQASLAGATRVALKVLSNNAAALRFYRAAGYDERFVVLERELNAAPAQKPD